MRLDQATSVIPLGIAMGVLVIGLNVITNVWIAAPFLVMLGAIGGYLVVPMNALLQHRGANLMGAGRSIAVQNFNEQACILGLGAFYTGMTRFGLSAFTSIGAVRRPRRRHDVADPPLAPVATASTIAARSSTCSRSRAATSIERRSRRQRATPARGLGAGLQRVRLGHLVVADAPAAGGGPASALGDGDHLHARLAGDRDRRGRARCAQVLRTPALWLLVAAAGIDQRAVQLGDRHRRRRPRRPAVLPDAAVDACCSRALVLGERLTRRGGAAHRPRRDRRGDRPLAAGAGDAVGDGFAALLPLPRSLADWLGVLGGFSFAFNNVMLRREAERPEEGRALAMFVGGAIVAGALAAVLTAGGARRRRRPRRRGRGWR